MNTPIYDEIMAERFREKLSELPETAETPPVRLPWWWRLLGRLGLWPQ